MIERVQLHRFRCFQSAAVPLRPLTVLIGNNDTGKSNFLHALKLATENKKGFSVPDYHRLDTTKAPSIRITVDSLVWLRAHNDIGWQWGKTPPRGGVPGPLLIPTASFLLPTSGPGMNSDGIDDRRGPPELSSTGGNVPALLDWMVRRDMDRFFAFVEALRAHVPGLEGIEIGTPSADKRTIEFRTEGGLLMPANRASAGVRMLVFFLALAYHPKPPKLILVEEPDNGLHPRRLANVMSLLRDITQGVHGEHAAQVVLTTHSPYLLDCVDLDTDQVLIFERQEDGARTVAPANHERLKAFMGDEFLLGEVWFNEGEQGLVR